MKFIAQLTYLMGDTNVLACTCGFQDVVVSSVDLKHENQTNQIYKKLTQRLSRVLYVSEAHKPDAQASHWNR
jgi:hypothetical protein